MAKSTPQKVRQLGKGKPPAKKKEENESVDEIDRKLDALEEEDSQQGEAVNDEAAPKGDSDDSVVAADPPPATEPEVDDGVDPPAEDPLKTVPELEVVEKPEDWPDDVMAVRITVPIFIGEKQLPSFLPRRHNRFSLTPRARRVLYLLTNGLDAIRATVPDARFVAQEKRVAGVPTDSLRWILENLDVPEHVLDQFPGSS